MARLQDWRRESSKTKGQQQGVREIGGCLHTTKGDCCSTGTGDSCSSGTGDCWGAEQEVWVGGAKDG